MAGQLNKIFTYVFTVENTGMVLTNPTLPRGIKPLEIGSIQEQEVQKNFDKLDINKSTGRNTLMPRLVKGFKQ